MNFAGKDSRLTIAMHGWCMEKIFQLLYCDSAWTGTWCTVLEPNIVSFAQAVDHTPLTIMTKQGRLLIRDIEMHPGFIATVKLVTDFSNRLVHHASLRSFSMHTGSNGTKVSVHHNI